MPGEDVAASGGAGATGPSPGTAQRLLGAQETFDKVKAATGVARAQVTGQGEPRYLGSPHPRLTHCPL